MAENLTYLIQRTVERDSTIRQGLARKLISPRALAAHIIRANPTQSHSLETLRTAIRRMEGTFDAFKEDMDHANRYIKDSKIHLRSGIVKVAFQKGDASLELINRGIKAMEIYGGDTFRVTKGQKILQLLVDHENLEKIKQVFHERILDIEEGICEITVILTKDAYSKYGMFASVINEVARNRISIVDAFSCGTEISMFLKEEDSQRAFNVLKDMIETAKNECKEKKKFSN